MVLYLSANDKLIVEARSRAPASEPLEYEIHVARGNHLKARCQ